LLIAEFEQYYKASKIVERARPPAGASFVPALCGAHCFWNRITGGKENLRKDIQSPSTHLQKTLESVEDWRALLEIVEDVPESSLIKEHCAQKLLRLQQDLKHYRPGRKRVQ